LHGIFASPWDRSAKHRLAWVPHAQDLIGADEYESLKRLGIRTRTAIVRLIKYLRSTETPGWSGH